MTGAADLADLTGIYRMYAHPELSFAEHRTAGVVAAWLRDLGYQTTTGVGRTGVVGVRANGNGPTVLLRADMDALPVLQRTGLDYRPPSVPRARTAKMDRHARVRPRRARYLPARRRRRACRRHEQLERHAAALFQPAEEVGEGAQAMIHDGLFDRFGLPDVVLASTSHRCPRACSGSRPARVRRRRLAPPRAARERRARVPPGERGGPGTDGRRNGAATARHRLPRVARRRRRRRHGRRAARGYGAEVISDQAELLLSVRSFNQTVRGKVLRAIERIVTAGRRLRRAGRPRDHITRRLPRRRERRGGMSPGSATPSPRASGPDLCSTRDR